MKGFDFPIFKTKTQGVEEKFLLEDPIERKKYFEAKAGPEAQALKGWLKNNTFLAILLGKKNSGKGTYTKLFMEAVGAEHVAHISVGDIVRSADQLVRDEKSRAEFVDFLKKRYRGFISIDQIVDIIMGRDTKTLLPTEVILSLVEREISKLERKAIFLDGFPRNLDQISYSLFFRALIGYRDDPDFMVFIDLPEAVIDERMKYRVVCPICHTPRNLKLLRTKEIKYNSESKNFSLICDNASCKGVIMIPKEGDELGIEAIRDRIEIDDKVMSTLLGLEGIDKVYLRNSVPVVKAKEHVDDYELTPAYSYEWDEKNHKTKVIEDNWTVKDDSGEDVYSLLPAAVALALIKQTAKILNL